MPGLPEPITFDQTLERIRQFHNLSDGLKQTVMLIGWQHRGHDTGFPDTSVVNVRAGGEKALLQLFTEAKALNAVITFHDTFHLAYKHSPAWNPEIVAREPDGDWMVDGFWAGGMSYRIGYARYAKHHARKRIEATYSRFPVKETLYLDQMNVYPDRYDYFQQDPSGPETDLAGCRAIIDLFRQRGIGVISESFSEPFVGHMTHGWLFSEDHACFGWMDSSDWTFSETKKIPFTAMVYHGRATYGGDILSDNDDPDTLRALYQGRTVSTHLGRGKTMAGLVLAHYLVNLPYLFLREREMEDYTEIGTRARLSYGPDPALPDSGKPTFVEVDFIQSTYEVVIEGRTVAKNFSTFAPSPQPGHWLAFAQKEQLLDYPAPEGWTAKDKLEAVCLTGKGPGEAVSCVVEGARIKIQVPARTPVRIRLLP